jgi:hypothetical protein
MILLGYNLFDIPAPALYYADCKAGGVDIDTDEFRDQRIPTFHVLTRGWGGFGIISWVVNKCDRGIAFRPGKVKPFQLSRGPAYNNSSTENE